jgi:ferredoxin--NADP+ reductase
LKLSDPNSFQRAQVVGRRDVAPDLWTLRVRPAERLIFKAGQYATLGIPEGEHMIERPYSIVSSPEEREVEFFFELVREGGLTPILHKLKVGETLWMSRQTAGSFTFDEASGRKQHFLVATVTGIAPFVSMVRTVAAHVRAGARPEHRLVVLHGASRSWEFAYHQELETLERDSDWFRYIPTISRPAEDPSWKGETGRVEDVLRKYLDAYALEPSTTTVYLCGHPQMISNARGILERRRFSKESVRQEIYWIPEEGVE